jgi:hypothetical protein
MMCLARRFTGDITIEGDETVAIIRMDAMPDSPAVRMPAATA